MRLGFVGDRAVFVDASGVWAEGGIARLVEALARRSDGLVVALSRAPRRLELCVHRLCVEPADFVPLPWVPSIARGFPKVLGCRRAIRAVERRCDVLIVQMPFAASLALLHPLRPRVYNLCADVRAVVRTSPWYRGPRRLAALMGAHAIDCVQARLVRQPNARLVAHGDELQSWYAPARGRSVVSSTILRDEVMSVRRRRPAEDPFRILFVGYLRHDKGIDTLVEAYSRLRQRLPDAELHLIGAENLTDQGVDAHIRARFAELQRRGAAVQFLGHRPFGQDLFQCFADADVLALPSRSEGTPRVLIEARAFGCPVVAARVGGVSNSVAHGIDGLLVEPDDPQAFCDAMLRLVDDLPLRQRLVAAGIERARRTTVDDYADTLVEQARSLVQGVTTTHCCGMVDA